MLVHSDDINYDIFKEFTVNGTLGGVLGSVQVRVELVPEQIRERSW